MKINRNFKKLRRLTEDAGLLQGELAKQIGVSESCLSGRVNSPEADGGWRSCEIIAICKVLHIPRSQIGEYFFPEVKEGNHDDRI